MRFSVVTRVLRLVGLAVLAAIALAACGVPATTPTALPTKTPTATPVPIVTPTLAPSPLPGAWQLVRIEYMSGKVLTIEKPESYSVEFQGDGKVRVKADCNGGTGAFQMSSGKLAIENIGLSKMACAAGSQGDLFTSSLTNAASYRVEGAELTITLKYDGGDLVFVKAR